MPRSEGRLRDHEVENLLYVLGDGCRCSRQNMNSIPSEKDWRGGIVERVIAWLVFGERRGDLEMDGEHAYREFFGKTHDEAVEMFREAACCHLEDLMYMPLSCFKFYVQPFLKYLRSDDSIGDSDGASCYLSLVEFRLHEIIRLGEPIRTAIFDTVQYLAENQSRFGAEPELHRSFKEQAAKLLSYRSEKVE